MRRLVVERVLIPALRVLQQPHEQMWLGITMATLLVIVFGPGGNSSVPMNLSLIHIYMCIRDRPAGEGTAMNEQPVSKPVPQPLKGMPQPLWVPLFLPKLQAALSLRPSVIALALGMVAVTGVPLLFSAPEEMTSTAEQERMAAFEAAGPLPLPTVNLADPTERQEAFQSLNLNPVQAKQLQTDLTPVSYTHLDVYKRQSSSSANSTALLIAVSPPAIIPTTVSKETPKVGGHSDASTTPNRPLVPAPI